MDCMIDMETLSVFPDSVILTVAAVKFNPHNTAGITDKIYLKVDIDEQIALGRDVDNGTLEWWGRQSPEVYNEALSESGRQSVADCLKQLTKFLVGVNNIWCQGPVFDIVILENIFCQYSLHCPWQYWQILDSRTLFKSLNFDPRNELRNESNLSHHNALDDAVIQSMAVQKCFKLLKGLETD